MGERKGWRVGSVRVEEREDEEAVIMLVLVMGLMALFSPIPCVDWSYSTVLPYINFRWSNPQ